MGLDIHLAVNNGDDVYPALFTAGTDESHKYSLSRSFCNIMCRKNVTHEEPEIEQIGRITDVDISPLYEMENFVDAEAFHMEMMICKTDAEREQKKAEIDNYNSKLNGNFDRVLFTVQQLIKKLSAMPHLEKQLMHHDFNSGSGSEYFSDFNTDKGSGYIGNNFGHDLRNFERFLLLAQSKGTRTVWFTYG
jgi:hypothetical protein